MAEKRYTLVFATAVVVALVATYGVYKVLQANAARSRVATRAVVIAAVDIPEGGLLDQTSITTTQWPVPTIPTGAYATPDSVIGRVTRVAIFKGEPLVPGRLAPQGASAGIEVRIPAGKRAMAIKINDVSGIAGMIQPNSRVDVLVTLRDQNTQNKQVAKVFMENMRVLSMGAEIERDVNGRAKPATTATLEVTPEQAEHLALAAAAGQLQLVLRGFGDRDSTGTEGATARDVLAQLRGMPISNPNPEPRREVRRDPPRRPTVVQASSPPPAPQPVVAPTRPESTTIEIYRGATKSEKQRFAKDTGQKQP
jgi:pilus assembly protein CpaB